MLLLVECSGLFLAICNSSRDWKIIRKIRAVSKRILGTPKCLSNNIAFSFG